MVFPSDVAWVPLKLQSMSMVADRQKASLCGHYELVQLLLESGTQRNMFYMHALVRFI